MLTSKVVKILSYSLNFIHAPNKFILKYIKLLFIQQLQLQC